MVLFKAFLAMSAICLCLLAMGMPIYDRNDALSQIGVIAIAAGILLFVTWSPS